MFAVNELLLTKATQTSNVTVLKDDKEEAQTVLPVLNSKRGNLGDFASSEEVVEPVLFWGVSPCIDCIRDVKSETLGLMEPPCCVPLYCFVACTVRATFSQAFTPGDLSIIANKHL